MTAVRRLQKEWELMARDPPSNVSAGPLGKDLFHGTATIIGPDGCPYAGGIFNLDIAFAPDHPFRPPKISFKTRIFHPNISTSGAICLDILKSNWSAALRIGDVLLSISSLLTEPNPTDPLNGEAGQLCVSNRKAFDRIAREWTVRYATQS